MKFFCKLLWFFVMGMIPLVTVGALGTDASDTFAGQEVDRKPAPKIVRIGGYDFPPYVEEASGKFTGLTLDLIEMMNAFQSKYRFEFVSTSSMRRYQDFTDGMYDVILFESVDWGWNDMPVDVSRVYARDCEVFVATTLPGRTQAYFDDLKGKYLRVYLGYHYPFAGYNADPAYLLRAFNARTTVSHEANIQSVIAGRADVAVVTQAYLRKYLRDHPAQIPRLLVSDRIAQTYHHTALVRKNTEPSVGEINALLDQMDRAGYISILLGKYGMSETLPSSVEEPAREDPTEYSPAADQRRRHCQSGGISLFTLCRRDFRKIHGAHSGSRRTHERFPVRIPLRVRANNLGHKIQGLR